MFKAFIEYKLTFILIYSLSLQAVGKSIFRGNSAFSDKKKHCSCFFFFDWVLPPS